jgi:hypothetical protein
MPHARMDFKAFLSPTHARVWLKLRTLSLDPVPCEIRLRSEWLTGVGELVMMGEFPKKKGIANE